MDKAKFYNPFRPTAGAEPPRIIGRDDISLEFVEGLMSGVGAPARLMRITGPRGSGKTVLLCDPLLFRLVRVCRTILWSRFKTN